MELKPEDESIVSCELCGKILFNGYTVDYEVERYYRDVRGWSMSGGTAQICLNRIADQILR